MTAPRVAKTFAWLVFAWTICVVLAVAKSIYGVPSARWPELAFELRSFAAAPVVAATTALLAATDEITTWRRWILTSCAFVASFMGLRWGITTTMITW